MIALCYATIGVLTGRHFTIHILIVELCFSTLSIVSIMVAQGHLASLIAQEAGVMCLVLQVGFLAGAFSTTYPSSPRRAFFSRKKRLTSPHDRG